MDPSSTHAYKYLLGTFNSTNPFKPIAKKVGGTAIGTIYQFDEELAKWIGKIGNPSLYLENDSLFSNEEIYSPEGKLIPLKGLMQLCVAIRVLADTDGLGGSLTNAGFVWEKGQGELYRLGLLR